MQSLRSLRRLALGAAIAGTAVGAPPALASAAPSPCSYSPNLHQVTATDNSGANHLTVTRSGPNIAISSPGEPLQLCMSDAEFDVPVAATVSNTDKIVVNAQGPRLVGPNDGFIIDERPEGAIAPGFTKESDGNSEIEIEVLTDQPARLTVEGTEGPDVVRIGRRPEGVTAVNFGPDNDVDARLTSGATRYVVFGLGGDDILSARGNPDPNTLSSSGISVDLFGGNGNDNLAGSRFGRDNLLGGNNDDFLASDNFQNDALSGGAGFDTALTDVTGDVTAGIEKQDSFPVGRLRLAPHMLRTRAGKTKHLRMSWTHPKAWRELRTVNVRLYDGAQPVGRINVRPRGERLSADGAIRLAAGSRVTHHGKTVTAKLAFRLSRSLAGHSLRVAVQATDRHGHEQLEPDAGTIRVGR